MPEFDEQEITQQIEHLRETLKSKTPYDEHGLGAFDGLLTKLTALQKEAFETLDLQHTAAMNELEKQQEAERVKLENDKAANPFKYLPNAEFDA